MGRSRWRWRVAQQQLSRLNVDPRTVAVACWAAGIAAHHALVVPATEVVRPGAGAEDDANGVTMTTMVA